MRKSGPLYIGFVLIVLLWIINFLAEVFYLYWTVWWFDNVSHFLAGLALGFVAVWVLFGSGLFYNRTPKPFESVFGALVAVFIAGVAWEIFEYANDMTQIFEKHWIDTTYDIIADLLGATLAGLVSAKKQTEQSFEKFPDA